MFISKKIITLIIGSFSLLTQAQFTSEKIITTTANGTRSIAIADVDGDGFNDIVSANRFDSNVTWYKNMGNQTFSSTNFVATINQPNSIYTSDLDGDNDIDILSLSGPDNKVVWYENTDGLGSFSTEKAIDTNADGAFFVITADIDSDGDQDILAALNTFNDIVWYENDGFGNFSTAQIVATTNNNGRSIAIADVDNDNDLDVVMSSSGNEILSWSKNLDGLGTFGSPIVIAPSALATSSVFSVDIDNNGTIDILTASPASDKISWYKNLDGLGNFSGENSISTAADFPRHASAYDLDNDGDIDVLSASGLDNTIAWYENLDGLGTFGTQQILNSNAASAFYVLAGDLDNDGDLDVVSASRNDDKIAWYENLTITLSNPTFNITKIEVYPNPTKNFISLNTAHTILKIELIDITGKNLKTYYNSNNTIDVSNFSNGVYFLKCYINNIYTIKKIVKK